MITDDIRDKLAILADAAKYDASCASSGSVRKNMGGIGNTEGMGICHSYTPDGRCVSLLKILLTNHCIFDCLYCINRVSSEVKRASFTVKEVVTLTLAFYRRNYIEGLFLSSGVLRTPDETMEQVVEVARLLREEHKYGGYIHLKAVAGASSEVIAKAGLYADRVSANIEFATEDELTSLAPAKDQKQIKSVMDELSEKISEAREDKLKFKTAQEFAPSGQSTQMIVGASGTTDRAILTTSSTLYEKQKLRRVYYTAFSPIPHSDARLPSQAAPLMREHRLYQADWLMRYYGFRSDELLSEKNPNLDLEKDPKLAWAIDHPEFFPVDVNRASREMLLRIPGVGVRNVEKILRIRRYQALSVADLKRLRVSFNKAKYFLVAKDWTGARPDKPAPSEQLSLFSEGWLAKTGEL